MKFAVFMRTTLCGPAERLSSGIVCLDEAVGGLTGRLQYRLFPGENRSTFSHWEASESLRVLRSPHVRLRVHCGTPFAVPSPCTVYAIPASPVLQASARRGGFEAPAPLNNISLKMSSEYWLTCLCGGRQENSLPQAIAVQWQPRQS